MSTTQPTPVRPVRILLVEDDEGDIELTRHALERGRVGNELSVVRDGEEALRFLNQAEEFADVHRPHLILLDINLPRKGGLQVLREIKADEKLREIPVVVLTTSDDEQDIRAAYRGYANAYLTKPMGFSRFMEVVGKATEYWVVWVQLPPRDD